MGEGDLEFLIAHRDLSYTEAAARLGLSKQRVYQICRAHNIKLTPYARIQKDNRKPDIALCGGGDSPFIYVVGESTKGPCKIGIAWSLERRLDDLQRGNHRELKVLFAISADDWRAAWHTEAKVHRRLAKVAMASPEWFSCSSSEAAGAIKLSLTTKLPKIPPAPMSAERRKEISKMAIKARWP
jgi:hypothetical protein